MKTTFLALGCLWILALARVGVAAEQSTATVGYQPPSPNQVLGLDLEYSSTAMPGIDVTAERKLSERAHSFRLGLEAILLRSVGKLGIGLASGFIRVPNISVGTERWASIYAIPVEMLLSYRFDYANSQWVVPFIQGGAKGVWVGQTSKTGDGKEGLRHNYGWVYGGGLELNIGAIDKGAANRMRNDYGIDNIYLILSYARTELLGDRTNPDISGDSIRAGLRFEM